MDTTTSVMATGVVVTVGRWSSEESLDFKMFVGFGFLAMFLAVLQSSNEKFAQQFATLILLSALFYYAIPISKKIGGKK